MASKRPPPTPGWLRTRISATIIDFGEPLLQQVPPDATLELRRATVSFIINVWNAHVMAMLPWGQPEFLAELRATISRAWAEGNVDAEAMAVIEILSARRRQKPFVSDPRAVGEWSVRMIDDEHWNLRCDAGLPEPQADPTAFPHLHPSREGARGSIANQHGDLRTFTVRTLHCPTRSPLSPSSRSPGGERMKSSVFAAPRSVPTGVRERAAVTKRTSPGTLRT